MTMRTKIKLQEGCGKSFIIDLAGHAAICGTLKSNQLCSQCQALLQQTDDILEAIDKFGEINFSTSKYPDCEIKTLIGFEELKQSIIGEKKDEK